MERPPFLPESITSEMYTRWLNRKAAALVRRDMFRGNNTKRAVLIAEYKREIHRAVIESAGFDAYTGERLDWTLISTYNNEASKTQRRLYRRSLALLPTIDHVDDGLGPANFRICSWRTNDAKNDLDAQDFLALCKAVLEHHGYRVEEINPTR